MKARVFVLALFAFLISSPAWATTSSCPSQDNSSDGCTTVNSQFVNVFTVGASISFDFTASDGHGSGPFGTVTLYQLHEDTVEVTVTLNSTLFPGIGFVNASGQEALDFNIIGNPDLNVTNLTAGFSFPGVKLKAAPFGDFMYGVHCDVCGKGGSNPNPGPLVFDVGLVSGNNLSILNFTSNAGGWLAASDIIANGATFDVSYGVPEPGTFGLMGGALALLGLFARRPIKSAA
jgi:PEP-CTERM motif